ncbi:hypothetical protein AgCh_018067 [Apium graveolens]
MTSLDSVYKHLMQLFPQVDARVLKVVAIENSKDKEVVLAVVTEDIIPFLYVAGFVFFFGKPTISGA